MRAGKFLIGCSAVVLAGACAARADVVISKQATANMSCSAGVCSPTAPKATLNATDLTNMLASGDVTVKTGSGATNIVVKDSFSWTSTSRVTLDAIQSVAFDKPVTVAGTGAVTITTNDGGTGGEFIVVPEQGSIQFWDLSSSLIIDGQSYTLVGDIKTLAADIAANPSGFYALAKPYDASADGTYDAPPITTTFAGTFEGLGNAISNVTIKFPAVDDNGFFRRIGPGATVSQINITNATLEGVTLHGMYAGVGILAGSNYGTVVRAFASGSVTLPLGDNELPGGLVGGNVGTVTNSHADVKVFADSDGPAAGGLVGLNNGTIEKSYATGKSTAAAGTGPGGLVGYNSGEIANSYSVAKVNEPGKGDRGFYGGLVGENKSGGRIAKSYAAGVIGLPRKKFSAMPGGLVGFDAAASGSITDCYWDLDKGVSDPSQGAGNIKNDVGITGLTTLQLQAALPPGFSNKIWGQNPNINHGLPYLLDAK